MTCTANNGEGCNTYCFTGYCHHTKPELYTKDEKAAAELDTLPTGEHTESLIERAIQVDLDNGRFMQICSNESTFKEYVFPLIAAAEAKGRREAILTVREIIHEIIDEVTYIDTSKGGFSIRFDDLKAKLDTAFPLE